MRRLFALALSAAALLAAQGLDSLSGWQFYKEISTGSHTAIATLSLDAEILANTRDDAADLRIFDAAGKEVPYELRVLVGQRNAESYEALEVSRGVEGDASEIILDLGENPGEHNQVQVDTQGPRFRRQVAVFGSDDAEQWTPLTERGLILRLTGNGGTAAVDRVPYPPSEYRYVRITVAPDQQADSEPPVIESAAVERATVVPGEEQAVPAESATRETIVEGELTVSRYTIYLPGRIPVHALRFNTPNISFVRTYQLLAVMGDNIAPFPLSVGRLRRSAEARSDVTTLRFQEAFARQLQLIIADGGDAPLDILEPAVLIASRQLVADLSAATAQPLRLYYGNPSAPSPDYNLKVELPDKFDETVPLLQLGPQQLNPTYEAPEPPLSEQVPWLIYVLTGAASLALLAILRSLVFDVDSQG
ncbi:MAG: DUF3999 family protein [Acidobacteria bacterium]|nr:DUF3999 family protein [Acidobacteriota bacterium]